MAAIFEQIDLLLIPAQPFASPTVERMATLGADPAELTALIWFTAPFDMSGSLTITLPAGFTDKGTPVAFQLVTRRFGQPDRACGARAPAELHPQGTAATPGHSRIGVSGAAPTKGASNRVKIRLLGVASGVFAMAALPDVDLTSAGGPNRFGGLLPEGSDLLG